MAFEPDTTAQEIAVAIERLEDGTKRGRPAVRFLYIEAQLLRARRRQPDADAPGALRAE